jgi:hypothetical protein
MSDPNAPVFGDPKGPWIKSFAWTPTFTIDAGWIWLRPIWKRHIHKHHWLDGGADFWWQHCRYKQWGAA